MARIRTIKPSFFTSQTVADIDDPWARLLFAGLWTHADDEGRMLEDRRLIRAAVFPLEDFTLDDIGEMVTALSLVELTVRYEVDGRRYLAVTNWLEHQRIDRPKPSEYPPPDEKSRILPANAPFDDAPSSRRRQIVERSTSDRRCVAAGREGKGREGKGTTRADTVESKLIPDTPFDDFWALYPRKRDRAEAVKVWNKLGEDDRQAAIAAIPRHAARWRTEHPDTDRFIPHGATWLNRRRWEDELGRSDDGSRVINGVSYSADAVRRMT